MTTSYGPYSPVREGGNFLFVSGQVGISPGSKTSEDTAAKQCEQALENMKHALNEMGADMQDIVKTTIFLTNMDDFDAVNAVYEKFFQTPRPARSTVGVHELPRVGGKIPLVVEIEAIAYKELS